MSNNAGRTPEQMAAYIVELESKLASKKTTKTPELRVSLIEGEVMIRNITRSAFSLPAEAWPKVIEIAPKILSFISQNKAMLTLEGDTEEVSATKRGLRGMDTTGIVKRPKANAKL